MIHMEHMYVDSHGKHIWRVAKGGGTERRSCWRWGGAQSAAKIMKYCHNAGAQSQLLAVFDGEVSHGEKMALRKTDPELYITEYTSVYEDKDVCFTGVLQAVEGPSGALAGAGGAAECRPGGQGSQS